MKTILTTTACNTRQEPKMTMTLAKRPVEMCTKPYLSFKGGSKRNQAENCWKKSGQAVGVKKYPIFKYINCFKIVSSNSRTGCWVTSVSLGERSTVLRPYLAKTRPIHHHDNNDNDNIITAFFSIHPRIWNSTTSHHSQLLDFLALSTLACV